ncbi:MAG: hypothetical protein ACXWLH_03215 [Candidatus Saccharimonadales bacterium]
MLGRSSNQKTVINWTLLFILAAWIGLFGLLIAQAGGISNSTDSQVYQTIAFGPVKLISLQKIALANGGHQAIIKLLPGLIVYFGSFIAVGLAAGLSRIKSQSQDTK